MYRLCTLIILMLMAARSTFASQGTPEEKPQPTPLALSRTFETPAGRPLTLKANTRCESIALTADEGQSFNLSRYSTLGITATREKAGSSVLRLRWVIQSRVGGMYMSALPTVVPSGVPANISVRLDQATDNRNNNERVSYLIPTGHHRPWDAMAAAEVTSIELRPECYFNPGVAGEAIALLLSNVGFEETAAVTKTPAVIDLRLQRDPAGSRAAALLSFRIDPPPADPYSADGESDVRVELPGGRQALAYVDQDSENIEDGSDHRIVAVGRPVWRAWLPVAPAGGSLVIVSGARRWNVPFDAIPSEETKAAEATLEPHAPQTASSGPSRQAPPRRSAPADVATASAWDATLEGKVPHDTAVSGGAPAFWLLRGGQWSPPDGRFSLKNVDEAWSPVPFWNSKWGGFGDRLRPSLEILTRADARLERAANESQTRPLVILDGGTFERQNVFNWDHHPLNGPLTGPGEIFRDPRGIDFCRRYMRYCIARWGYSKAVNSLLLTSTLYAPAASSFHTQIAAELQKWADCAGLPVITLHPFAREPELVTQISSFESDPPALNPWRADLRMAAAEGKRVSSGGSDGASSFEVRATDPNLTTTAVNTVWMFGAPEILSQADAVLFDVWLPPGSPPDLRIGVHVCDRYGRWYETLLPGLARPGDWTTYVMDVSSENVHKLKPVKHDAPWTSTSRERLSEMGLHVYSIHPRWGPKGQQPMSLTARFDNVRAVRFPRENDVRPPPPLPINYNDPKTVADAGNFDKTARARYNWFVDERVTRGTGSVVGGGREGAAYEVRADQTSTVTLGLIGNSQQREINYRDPPDNLGGADALLFDVFVAATEPPDLRVGIHVRDRDGHWFQAMLPGCPKPGEWNTFGLDLTGGNYHGLRSVAQPPFAPKTWTDYSRQRVRQVGLYVFSTHPDWKSKGVAQVLSAKFDNIRAVKFETPEPRRVITPYDIPQDIIAAAGPSIEVDKQGVDANEYAVGDIWQMHFKVNKSFANPFDPRECDLTAAITLPSGKRVRVPAFFNQVCRRREATPGGDEVVEPLGDDFFTVRYRILEAGGHQVTLELREGGKYDTSAVPGTQSEQVRFAPGRVTSTLDIGPPAFVARKADAGKFHGFIRVADNKRYFQWDDGTFFYPIGPCLRSPSDNRIPYIDDKWNDAFISRIGRRGTYQYDDYFAEYQKAGINWARVWMCSWWVSIEWRRDWPDYQGVGRYNLMNAWRLDYLLDQAYKKDLTLMLCLTNHGQYSVDVDKEWSNNPYNAALGGPLPAASSFFSAAEARIWHENKLRYIAARWGHSPAVMAWSLFSEVEWTQEYADRSLNWNGIDRPAPNVENWHNEMGAFLKQVDVNKHLVSTHFSHPVRGEGTLLQPEIDIASSNAYSAFDYFKLGEGMYDAASSLHDYWAGNNRGVRGFKIFNKPAMVEEQGRHWMGVDKGRNNNTREQLDADLHAGLWGSMVQPLCGATGYWWWLHLHYDNRYDQYRALANFMKGEDFRSMKGETILDPVSRTIKAPGADLTGRALKSDRRMYAWIYHPQMPLGNACPDVNGGTLRVSGLKAGAYAVEFWDTYKGEVSERRDIQVQAGTSVEMPLPTVHKDLAVKIKPK